VPSLAPCSIPFPYGGVRKRVIFLQLYESNQNLVFLFILIVKGIDKGATSDYVCNHTCPHKVTILLFVSPEIPTFRFGIFRLGTFDLGVGARVGLRSGPGVGLRVGAPSDLQPLPFDLGPFDLVVGGLRVAARVSVCE
jgi:hypothetical protein